MSDTLDIIINDARWASENPILALKRKPAPGTLHVVTVGENIPARLWFYDGPEGAASLASVRKNGVTIGLFGKLVRKDGETLLFGTTVFTELQDARGDYGYSCSLNLLTDELKNAFNQGFDGTAFVDIRINGVRVHQFKLPIRPRTYAGTELDTNPAAEGLLEEMQAAAAEADADAAAANAAKVAAEGFRDEAQGFRNEAEGFRNESEAARDDSVSAKDISVTKAGEASASATAAAGSATAAAASAADAATHITGAVKMETFGATTGAADNTTAIQNAINYAATNGKVLVSGPGTFLVTQLSLPSNLQWFAEGTVIKAVSGSNRAVLVNANSTFVPASVSDKGIHIFGLTVDHDGANQADSEVGGVWNCPIRFTGVEHVSLKGVTVLRQRRFGIVCVNASRLRFDVRIIADSSVTSTNKDGVHINGNSRDIEVRMYGENLNDDALALNADDGDYGGGYSMPNLSGPIENIVADVVLKNCLQGVRLLSAVSPVRHCRISVSGNTTKTGLIVESYGLGGASLYQDIVFDNFDLEYQATVSGACPMLLIDTSTQATGTRSDFTFNRVKYKGSGGNPHGVVIIKGKDADVRIGEIVADGFGFSDHRAVLKAESCSGGHHIRVGSLVMRNTVNNATAYAVQTQDSVIESLVIDYADVDNIRNTYHGYATASANNSRTKLLRYYSPNPAAITGAMGTFYIGDWHFVDRSEITGPNTQTKSGYGSGKRWGVSTAGPCAVTKDLPNYLGGQTSDRPTGIDIGTEFWDWDLGVPVFWNGAAWKNSAGASA